MGDNALLSAHEKPLGESPISAVKACSNCDGTSLSFGRMAIDKIIQLADLGDVPTHQVLDCCHAVHHVSSALASLGLSTTEQMLQVRSQVVTDRWDAQMLNLANFRRTQGAEDWKWKPRPMSCKVEDHSTTAV